MATLLNRFFTLAVLIVISTASHADVFSILSPESENDTRQLYEVGLIKLALEKTRDTYGDYEIRSIPVMNRNRVMQSLKDGRYPNLFIKTSYEKRFEDEGLDYVPFPIDRGIVGYRICFVPEKKKKAIAEISRLEELKTLKHVQGAGWTDTKLLRAAGFDVHENPDYEGLFRMIAVGRADLFCRGVNELLDEWEAHKALKGLDYDESFILAYPLPRFFYTNANNQQAICRLTDGILIAYRDGSLQNLWEALYQQSIDFANLSKRKIFWIENPELRNLDIDYQQYFYNPLPSPVSELDE